MRELPPNGLVWLLAYLTGPTLSILLFMGAQRGSPVSPGQAASLGTFLISRHSW